MNRRPHRRGQSVSKGSINGQTIRTALRLQKSQSQGAVKDLTWPNANNAADATIGAFQRR
jgi:hypothetical protein